MKIKKTKTTRQCDFCKKTKTIAHWFYRNSMCGNCFINEKIRLDGFRRGPEPYVLKLKRCYYCKRKREQLRWVRGPQCDECVKKFGIKPRKEITPLSNIYRNKKDCAKGRGHKWLLSPNQFYELIKNPCFYCGGFSTRGVSGVDRIDSLGEYSINNVVPSCPTCNRAKAFSGIDEFAEYAKRLSEKAFWKTLTSVQKYQQIVE